MNGLEYVLIVDDDDVCNFLVSKLLNKVIPINKMEIALNGDEAIDYLDECPPTCPSLVILDLNMPMTNGFEVLQHYTDSGSTGCTRFAVLTSSSQDDDKNKAATYEDVIAYIEKPLTETKLRSVLEKL